MPLLSAHLHFSTRDHSPFLQGGHNVLVSIIYMQSHLVTLFTITCATFLRCHHSHLVTLAFLFIKTHTHTHTYTHTHTHTHTAQHILVAWHFSCGWFLFFRMSGFFSLLEILLCNNDMPLYSVPFVLWNVLFFWPFWLKCWCLMSSLGLCLLTAHYCDIQTKYSKHKREYAVTPSAWQLVKYKMPGQIQNACHAEIYFIENVITNVVVCLFVCLFVCLLVCLFVDNFCILNNPFQ